VSVVPVFWEGRLLVRHSSATTLHLRIAALAALRMAPPGNLASSSASAISAVRLSADREAFPTLSAFLEHPPGYHEALPVEEVRAALLEWYRANRRRLPWRGDSPPYNGSTAGTNKAPAKAAAAGSTPFRVASASAAAGEEAASEASTDGAAASAQMVPVSPYGVWVSEIMCQQTRVEVRRSAPAASRSARA
jgi:A/G-specific adenine glycosylase